jgi:hypothetical protein
MLTGPYETRNKVASAMMMGWAARLALFLLFRVLKTGSDNRFDEIRSKFWSFAGFWAGQILWVWIVAFPIVTVNSPGVSDRLYGGRRVVVGAAASDIVGIVLFAIGFLVESISDIQKVSLVIGILLRMSLTGCSTCTSRQTLPRASHVTRVCGNGVDTHLTLARSSSTGVSGFSLVSDAL